MCWTRRAYRGIGGDTQPLGTGDSLDYEGLREIMTAAIPRQSKAPPISESSATAQERRSNWLNTGSISDTTPTYTWNAVNGATWYYLWVDGPSGNVIKTWYEATAICSAATCSVTPDTTLGSGAHKWWVRTWSSAGYGPWSAEGNFSLP